LRQILPFTAFLKKKEQVVAEILQNCSIASETGNNPNCKGHEEEACGDNLLTAEVQYCD